MSAAVACDPFAGPDYAFWRGALAGSPPELTVGVAEPGFYRHQDRRGMHAVAVWIADDGRRWARVGDRDCLADDVWCERVFAFCAKNPITDDVYYLVADGGDWPDAPPRREADYSNMPADPFEALRAEIEGERAEVELWLKQPIADQAACDRAANWADRVAGLEKRADTMRVEEKRPHDDASKAVQARFKPLVDLATALKRQLKDAQEPFLKERRRQEAEARAAAARVGEASAPAKPVNAGTMGRKTGLRTERRAEIVDYDALLAAVKDNARVRDFVQQIANAVARETGNALPGCKIVITEKVA